MNQPFQIENHCFLVAMSIQTWAKSMGWKSRIISVHAKGDKTWHACVIIDYEDQLRLYDQFGTDTLPKKFKLTDNANKIAKYLFKKTRIGSWRTPIV